MRRVSPNFDRALSKYFGTRTPDPIAAQGAHDAYVMALRAHGTEVEILDALTDHPDCCFVEDCAVMVDGVALISNLGAPSRVGEEEAVARYLSEDSEILRMPEGATLDGGDVVFFDDRYLIGLSTRTNRRGADFLAEQVKSEGFDYEFIDIPRATLHLTTVCSSPREGTLVAAEGHLTEIQVGTSRMRYCGSRTRTRTRPTPSATQGTGQSSLTATPLQGRSCSMPASQSPVSTWMPSDRLMVR